MKDSRGLPKVKRTGDRIMKYGLKLWSNNESYVCRAEQLYEKKAFDYIELYIVPGTYDKYIKIWRSLDIPFMIHCTHSIHGFNLALKECEQGNIKIFRENLDFCNELEGKYIIFHPGLKGDLNESVRQIKNIYDKRLLVENKPYFSIYGDRCRGSEYPELEKIITSTGVGFCLDISHAINAAFNLSADADDYMKKLIGLSPKVIHLADGKLQARQHNKHLHIGAGDYDFKKIMGLLETCGTELFTIETCKDNNELADFIEDIKKIKEAAFL